MLYLIVSIPDLCTLTYFCSLLIFLKTLFEKKAFKMISEFQTVWILIRPDDSSALTWVQTIWEGHKQTTLVDKELIKRTEKIPPNSKEYFDTLCLFSLSVEIPLYGHVHLCLMPSNMVSCDKAQSTLQSNFI